MATFLGRFFGSYNERLLRRYQPKLLAINAAAGRYRDMSDTELAACTEQFRKRHSDGTSLDELVVDAFAAMREASERVLGMRHFDVQILGGLALHEGNISEMATGEGKTLVATLALYLNALSGSGVHLVTVNNYLAERDAGWMAPLYEFMGMSVGVVLPQQSPDERRIIYASDICYGTNNEFGFDYLRDNMALALTERVQRGLHFAIVDEVDSILIDEARTPLVISGAAEDSSDLYRAINKLIPGLIRAEHETADGHYVVDEKQRRVELSELGHRFVESWLTRYGLLKQDGSLYEAEHLGLLHHVHAALRAHILYQPNVHYVVRDKEVLLIDEHTGRTMSGRRLSEGLHQALEARENLPIQSENRTLASITFQNYFRLYGKLSGMTGTAVTEAAEFQQIYGLNVVAIPPNKPVRRSDHNDLVYLDKSQKTAALINDIKECVDKGAPVLVGTVSIESSEELARVLGKAGVKHEVLNAKQHEREAHIIADAGLPGAVTIATNMAGRGTDIVLGGHPDSKYASVRKEAWADRHDKVLSAGGLHVLGTERHESRRIDNQLRGRAGRQGDPGVSRFYLSMEDNLMRIFVPERIKSFMQNLGLREGEAIENKMVSNAIEKAQKRVEAQNFEMRKQLLEYDDIVDVQRKVVYAQRLDLLESDNIEEDVADIREEVLQEVIDASLPPGSLPEEWDMESMQRVLMRDFALKLSLDELRSGNESLEESDIREHVLATARSAYELVAEHVGATIRKIERYTLLQVLDMLWRRHLNNIDQLRQGIHLRAYAQRNPKEEYKRESFYLFQEMLRTVKYDITSALAHIDPQRAKALGESESSPPAQSSKSPSPLPAPERTHLPAGVKGAPPAVSPTVSGKKRKIGRNDPCFCGSGEKYKRCHGR